MLVNYKKYAELCKLDSVQAVYARVKAGKIIPTEHDEPDGSKTLYIDTDLYPPYRAKKGQGRKKK